MLFAAAKPLIYYSRYIVLQCCNFSDICIIISDGVLDVG